MTIDTFCFNPFSTNCYIVSSEGESVIIDPSCHSAEEIQVVIDHIEQSDSQLKRMLLTHAHIDHIFGCADISAYFGIGLEVHGSETLLLERAEFQSQMFGIECKPPPKPVRIIEPGERIRFGNVEWNVLHTPGHSPGSVSFHDMKHGTVFSGDVLFAGSIGRTDLWQGSMPVLMDSVFQQIIPLGDDTRVLSGHGPETTVGQERVSNPFLTDHPDIG